MRELNNVREFRVSLLPFQRCAVQQRLIVGTGVTLSVWIGLAGVLLFVSGSIRDLSLHRVWLPAVGAMGIVVAVYLIGRPLWKLRNPDTIVRLMGDVEPGIVSSLMSALAFCRGDGCHRFSRTLMERHIERTSRHLQTLSPRRIFPRWKLVFAMLLVLVTSLTIAAVAVTHPAVYRLGLERLRTGELPDLLQAVDPISAPVAEDVSLVLHYPAYLNRPRQVIESLTGGFSAPFGTSVSMQGKSIVSDSRSGYVLFDDGTRIALDIGQDNTFGGTFEIGDMAWFRLVFETRQRRWAGPRQSIDVDPDHRPAVRLLRPAHHQEMRPEETLKIEYEVKDDYGISRVDLVVSGHPDLSMEKTILRPGRRINHVKKSLKWSPRMYRYADYPNVTITLKAYDNNRLRGPSVGVSEPLEISVLTEENRRQDIVKRQSRILDQMVDLLAFRLTNPVPASYKKADEITKRFLSAKSMTEDVARDIVALLDRLDSAISGESIIDDAFRHVREQLLNQLRYEQRMNQLPLAPYKKRNDVDRVTIRLLERSVSHVDSLLVEQQFGNMRGIGDALFAQRHHLHSLLKAYRENGSERQRRLILGTVARMEALFSRLSAQLETVRGDAVFSRTASSVIDDTLALRQVFSSLRVLLADNQIDEAMGLARQLETELSMLMTQVESGHLSFRNDRFGEQEAFLDQLSSRIDKIEAQQLQLRRNTVGTFRRYKERLLALMKREIDPLIRSQQGTVNRIRQNIEGLSSAPSDDSWRLISSLRKLMIQIDDAMRLGDLDRILETAEEMQQRIRNRRHGKRDIYRKQLKKVEAASTQLQNRIRTAFPNPARVLGRRERNSVKNQSYSQRAIAMEVKKLRRWNRDQHIEMMYLQGQTDTILGDIAEALKKSTVSLEQNDIQESIRQQTIALSHISQLEQRLQNPHRTPLLHSRPDPIDQHVQIPAAEDFEIPREFKEDIMNAMQDTMPDKYKDAINRYYERLVQ